MREISTAPRWVFVILGVLGLALAFTAIPSPVIMAQQASTPGKETTAQAVTEELPPLPLSPIEKAKKDGTALPLSLKDLTKLALQNNLDIAIQDTNEQTSQQKIIQAYGSYDPTLSLSANTRSSKSPNTNIASQSVAANYSKNESASWQFDLSQPMKTGGTLKASWSTQRSYNDSTFALFTPQYSPSLSFSFTQPLWRNFRIDQTRGQIKLYNLDLQNSDSTFKQLVTNTISNIQGYYWDLVSAIRDYEIKRDSVKLGQITLQNNRKKVAVGTAAPIEVTQAQADLAQRELNLISSEAMILSRENTLRQAISNNRNADIWTKVIVPTDEPEFREYKIDPTKAIETALKNRPELEQIDIQLRQSDINQQMLRNGRKWQVDVTGTFGSNGISGPQVVQVNPITGKLTQSTPQEFVGGLPHAYKTIFSEGLINWQVQFQVQVPLRNRSSDAQIAQQEITKRKTLMQRKSQEQSIQVDISNALQQLETNRQQVKTSQVGVQLSKEQLDGEEKRFQAGLSENYLVLQRQNDLANSEGTALTALINYRKSIIALEKAMYTLLESNQFEIAKGSSNNVPDLK